MVSIYRYFSYLLALILCFSYFNFFLIKNLDLGTAHLQTFRVDTASLNLLTLNGTKLTSGFNVSLVVSNPYNNYEVYFDEVSADIFYRDEGSYTTLNRSTLPSFNIDSTGVVKMTWSVNETLSFGVMNNIYLSRRKYGMVQFGLNVSARVRFMNIHDFSTWKSLKVVCYPLKFAISPNANNTSIHEIEGILVEGLNCF